MSIRPSLALLGERMNGQKMRFYSVPSPEEFAIMRIQCGHQLAEKQARVYGTLYSHVGIHGNWLMAAMCGACMLLVVASYFTRLDDDFAV